MNIEAALWIATDRDTGEKRKDKNGNPFFTGNIQIGNEKHKIVGFMNKPKTNPRAPDIKIMLSSPAAPHQEKSDPAPPMDESDIIPF